MPLPNLSHMVYVGQLRHIQAAYEAPEYQNPDRLIHHFLSGAQLLNCRLRGRLALRRLRKNPFYYYVLARTRYYDEVFASAIASGVQNILNIGCGSDTRAYRFADQLRAARVNCVECDQAAAIMSKERLARRKLNAGHVQYMPIDLNVAQWDHLDQWLASVADSKVLVMMEGVSPYIDRKAFEAFLALLTKRLTPGSRLAYDFKLEGVADGFGRKPSVAVPFRLQANASNVRDFHTPFGLNVEHFELGEELVRRTVARVNGSVGDVFAEDALVQLTVSGKRF